ncbi:MAG: IPT/TIG domain-containing protein, partial [Actinomycetales bacterium]
MRWANGTGPVAPIAYVLLVVCSLVNPASAQAANPPNVNQLTPSTGPVNGGQQVVISGIPPTEGIAGPTHFTISGSHLLFGRVTISGAGETLVSPPTSDSSLIFQLPASARRVLAVTVTTAITLEVDGRTFRTGTGFTYRVGEPSVTMVTPATGPDTGGSRVTLTGENLDQVTEVRLAQSGRATIVNSAADRIVIETPRHRPVGQPMNMPDLTQTFILVSPVATVRTQSTFTYVQTPPVVNALEPDNGPLAGGTEVTITGSNLGRVREVTFGSAGPGTILSASDNSVLVRSPSHRAVPDDIAEPISLTVTWQDVADDTEVGTKVFATGREFNYEVPDPVIRSVAPDEGPLSGGTEVVITGRNHGQVTSVAFGTRPALIKSRSATRLEVESPAGVSPGPVRITVRSASGSDRERGAFTYIAAPSPTPTPSA